jgi:hypothetical protein
LAAQTLEAVREKNDRTALNFHSWKSGEFGNHFISKSQELKNNPWFECIHLLQVLKNLKKTEQLWN